MQNQKPSPMKDFAAAIEKRLLPAVNDFVKALNEMVLALGEFMAAQAAALQIAVREVVRSHLIREWKHLRGWAKLKFWWKYLKYDERTYMGYELRQSAR